MFSLKLSVLWESLKRPTVFLKYEICCKLDIRRQCDDRCAAFVRSIVRQEIGISCLVSCDTFMPMMNDDQSFIGIRVWVSLSIKISFICSMNCC